MSFVNQYRSTNIYGELKVQKYNTGGVNGLLDVSGNTILRGDVGVYGNLYASDGTVDISGNLSVSGNITAPFFDGTADKIRAYDVSGNNDDYCIPYTQVPSDTFATTDSAIGIDPSFSFNPSTGTLNVPNINGVISNNATTATIATDATNASFYPTFVSTTTGNLPLKTDSDITYNPSTNTLTVSNITGTASAATNATNITIAAVATNADFYITFVSGTAGNLSPKVDGGITYNPSTNTLSVSNITGTASNATLASTITATGVSTNASYRVPFLSANTGTASISSDGGLTYNPSTNTLTTTVLNGTCLSVGAGVWLIDGTNTGSFNAAVPLFTSQPYLSDINDQSTLTFTRQTTDYATGGSYLNPFDNFDKIDTIIVFPRWGIVGFVDSNYATGGGILINYKNIYDFPVFVNVTDNQLSSCKIYFNDIEQV